MIDEIIFTRSDWTLPLKILENSILMTYRRNEDPRKNITIDEGPGRLNIKSLCRSIPDSCLNLETISIKVRLFLYKLTFTKACYVRNSVA